MPDAPERPAPPPQTTTSRAAAQQRRAARQWRPHVGSASVAIVILVAAIGVAIGLSASTGAATRRALATQVREVSQAFEESIPQIRDTLRAADELAGTSVASFRGPVVADQVGSSASGAPFRSVSLWSVSPGGAPIELAVLGERPELLRAGQVGASAVGRVQASAGQLSVLGLFTQPRVLGVAVRLPGPHANLVVYAENWLPSTTPGSPLYGLDFALFFGRTTSPSALMETTISLPARGSTRTSTLSFGSATLTVLVELAGEPPGAVNRWVIAGVLIFGVLLALASGTAIDLAVRRRELAESVATLRSHEYDTQRQIAQTLQDALRPSTPAAVEGLEVATRYVAGVANLDVGGDWFDAIEVDPTRIFITVGDVSGRGLAAATVMGSLRHAIRAYALQGDEPDEVLRKLAGFVDVNRDGCFATVLCAVFDVRAKRVTIANAGHPPPLVLDGTGARFVAAHVGAPVGVRSRNLATPSTFQAVSGTTFFLYTDGLIERRGRSLDEGLELLASAAIRADGPLEDLIEGILADLAPGGGEDDLAVFGLRWT